MPRSQFDHILAGLRSGRIVPYLGPQVLDDVTHSGTGEPIPAADEPLIMAMTEGRPISPKLMTEFPRAAMHFELKKGRRFLSSFLTAVIASLVMVEAVKRLALEKRTESAVVVLACFSIGLGAALTPFGEPLAAVAISRLSDAPYHAGTWFLLETLGMYVTPGILLVSVASLFFVREAMPPSAAGAGDRRETLVGALVRAGKVYLFVVGLLLLGAGFTPLISRLVSSVPWPVLFWANLSSAVLDNATLTATEIVPSMTSHQLVAALMGLLIAGGMLVPGNLPNVIAAGRLGIDSRTWARIGVPVGLGMMAATCAALALGG